MKDDDKDIDKKNDDKDEQKEEQENEIKLGNIIQFNNDPAQLTPNAAEMAAKYDNNKDYRKMSPSHGTDADPYDPRNVEDKPYKTQFNMETALQVLKNKKKFVLYDEPDKKKDDTKSNLKSIKFLPEEVFFKFMNSLTEQSKKAPEEELTPEQAQQLLAAQQAQDPNAVQEVPQEVPAQEVAVDANGNPMPAEGVPAEAVPAEEAGVYDEYLPPTPAEETGATYAADTVTADQVGRVYELKRIYNRLIAAEEYLSYSSDKILVKMRKYVSDAIELFELVISNIDLFKDRIDSIIIDYYSFLMGLYKLMKVYFDRLSQEDINEDYRAMEFMGGTATFLRESTNNRNSREGTSMRRERFVIKPVSPKESIKRFTTSIRERIKASRKMDSAMEKAQLNQSRAAMNDVVVANNQIRKASANTAKMANTIKKEKV